MNRWTTLYFNPRTPVGCDQAQSQTITHTKISIHAPQWGATTREHHAEHHPSISIHAPQWGATLTRPGRNRQDRNFNPRTPVGCDSPPTWPAPRTGKFQSTHPSGVRRWFFLDSPSGSYFNPRTPVGCDGNHAIHFRVDGISIHAPQWGATLRPTEAAMRARISIHAPQWGATSSGIESVELTVLFQSTHPSGVRLFLFNRKLRF